METKFAEIPDELWEQVEPLLPTPAKRPRRGRPPIPNRTILSGIVYRLRTGSQWKALPAQFGSGSACHARFQAWSEAGIFRRLFEKLVRFYDDVRGVRSCAQSVCSGACDFVASQGVWTNDVCTGALLDAGVSVDATADGGKPPPPPGGCGCAAANAATCGGGASVLALGLALALATRRRRR